jgi:hypothetical protein
VRLEEVGSIDLARLCPFFCMGHMIFRFSLSPRIGDAFCVVDSYCVLKSSVGAARFISLNLVKEDEVFEKFDAYFETWKPGCRAWGTE